MELASLGSNLALGLGVAFTLQNLFWCLMGAIIGFYDGVFGPGTGSFLTVGFVTLLGFGLTRAAGSTKILNLTSNIGALTLFIATAMGIPVSTTHTITGAIVGVGSVQRASAVRWGVAGNIVWAWVFTIPASAFVAIVAYWVSLKLF